MTRITFDGSYKKVERSFRVIYINMDILLFLISKYKCGIYSSNIDIIHITFPIEELCSYVARSDRFFFSKTLIIFVLSASKCNVIVALLTRGNPVLKCSYLL